MPIAAVSVSLRPSSVLEVRELLRSGPPVELDELALDRECAFVAGTELLLLFEGDAADRIARSLTTEPRPGLEDSALGRHVAGPPRLLGEPFVWTDSQTAAGDDPGGPPSAGVSFGPLPGPGHSEGGTGDL
jgi:hypothetical protein